MDIKCYIAYYKSQMTGGQQFKDSCGMSGELCFIDNTHLMMMISFSLWFPILSYGEKKISGALILCITKVSYL